MSEMYERSYGENYISDMDTKDIAKIVRTYIRKTYPSIKASVRSKYFSGGSSIDVYLKEFKKIKNPYNPNYIPNRNNFNDKTNSQILPEVKEIMDDIRQFMNSFNFDGSDSMTDYFDVKFYGHVSLWWEKDHDWLKEMPWYSQIYRG